MCSFPWLNLCFINSNRECTSLVWHELRNWYSNIRFSTSRQRVIRLWTYLQLHKWTMFQGVVMVIDFTLVEIQQKPSSHYWIDTYEMVNLLLSCFLNLLIDDGFGVKVFILSANYLENKRQQMHSLCRVLITCTSDCCRPYRFADAFRHARVHVQ